LIEIGIHFLHFSMDTTQRILEAATEMFLKQGIRSVSMDDVARATGISKRTIYEHYQNKDELLAQCILHHNQKHEAINKKLEEDAKNIIDLMHRHFRNAVVMIQNTRAGLANELKKYHPLVYQSILLPLEHRGQEMVTAMLQKGIDQGLFREDVNPEIASILLHTQVALVTDTDTFPGNRFSRADVFRHIMISFLRGIATAKGIKEIDILFYSNPEKDVTA
jgi:TetR/AcrR family transcriptional regulator, cholesterol catabolism regulator